MEGAKDPSLQLNAETLGWYPKAHLAVQELPWLTAGPSSQDGLAALEMPLGAGHSIHSPNFATHCESTSAT